MKKIFKKAVAQAKSAKKSVVVATGVVLASANAHAGVLTAGDVNIDQSDVTIIFGALIAFGVVFYGLKKAKSFLGV